MYDVCLQHIQHTQCSGEQEAFFLYSTRHCDHHFGRRRRGGYMVLFVQTVNIFFLFFFLVFLTKMSVCLSDSALLCSDLITISTQVEQEDDETFYFYNTCWYTYLCTYACWGFYYKMIQTISDWDITYLELWTLLNVMNIKMSFIYNTLKCSSIWFDLNWIWKVFPSVSFTL